MLFYYSLIHSLFTPLAGKGNQVGKKEKGGEDKGKGNAHIVKYLSSCFQVDLHGVALCWKEKSSGDGSQRLASFFIATERSRPYE